MVQNKIKRFIVDGKQDKYAINIEIMVWDGKIQIDQKQNAVNVRQRLLTTVQPGTFFMLSTLSWLYIFN